MTHARLCLTAGLCLAILAAATGQRNRALGLEQILDDGQPEDIGYGFQRARTTARNIRNTRPEPSSLLLMERSALQDGQDSGLKHRVVSADPSDLDSDESVTSSAFRERLASRQRRQRQQQQQQQQQTQWGDWRRENPGVSSFYPAGGASDPLDNPERYLQALHEAWARYQQQTGAIDVGPDDLTDLETLQFLEALGEDIPGTRKRASNPGRQYANGAASPFDWATPLTWTGYQLRKRSASPDYQDDAGDWSDEAAVAAEPGYDGVGPAVPNSKLAMLLTQQLFDERYNDPAVKRLLLAKRSLPGEHQHGVPKSADDKVETGSSLPGLQGRAMRRRKKSTRPALDIGQVPPQAQAHDSKQELMAIFGENEPDGELEPPLALPVADQEQPAPAPAASSTVAPASASTAVPTTAGSKNSSGPNPIAMNPIGHAHETDKLAKEHTHQHASSSTPAPVHTIEHAPPMVSAEGPHGHDQAVHAEDKKPTQTPATEVKPGGPQGAAGGPGSVAGAHGGEVPTSLGLTRPRRLAKKSIDWSQYFGIDRRRKKSLSLNDVDAGPAQVDADWFLRHNVMALSKFPKPSNINKRVAIKREGASPDSLLMGAWSARAWDASDAADEEDAAGLTGRCPAVTRLAESCRRAVGTNDGLLPLCVLYQACHLCSAAMNVPVGASCEAELGRRGADLCATSPSPIREEECRVAVEAIVELYRSKLQADEETCAKQPCLAHFFLTAPAVAFAR